jgi:hypothetical protein
VPDPPVILVVVRVHDKLVEFVVTARVTVPPNPFTGATVIVDVAATPVFTVTLFRLAETVKSWTLKVRVAEWDSEALVPVTRTRNVSADPNAQEIVAVPEPMTLFGEIPQDVLLVTRLTPPVKLLTGVTVIVEVAIVPTLTMMLVGLAEIVKSWTRNVTNTEWIRELLVPVTETCL